MRKIYDGSDGDYCQIMRQSTHTQNMPSNYQIIENKTMIVQ